MKYDFDTVIDRRDSNSYKWDISEDELPMWVADMDFRTAPEIIKVLTERVEHGIFGYATNSDEWYRAYINWWKNRHGIKYKKEHLIFSTGVIPTISSCVRRLTAPAENVLIMTPVYNIFYNCIRNNGRNVLECPLEYNDGEYSINWASLEEKLADPQTTLMLLCNPHNPIGKIWGKETLSKIGGLAYDNGVAVISDEIHCDITDPDRSYVPFASVSEKCAKNCVICIAPTKAFNLAGLQTSAALVPELRLRHKVWRGLNTDECGEPNAFAVQATVAAFNYGGEWLDELREYIYKNKQTVKKFLAENIPQIKLVSSDATYLLWLDCSSLNMNSRELAAHIRKTTGLYLSDGIQFGNGERFLRMNIACLKTVLMDGLNRLKKAVELL
ncbi:MAG: pyridoxal phosphate-dependent aminotransferase [Bacteroides sp.]|nr:pyridoxal phosphate-dependent aminotransferase [Eubacterium sp.]MCM1418194.1 pyridoxal phosphate-dependent aminotransferase [Roseburia sp.]MCM1462743.1 pyridoxal phosphate-dependent aminotransferase [Bacteroides sp.]